MASNNVPALHLEVDRTGFRRVGTGTSLSPFPFMALYHVAMHACRLYFRTPEERQAAACSSHCICSCARVTEVSAESPMCICQGSCLNCIKLAQASNKSTIGISAAVYQSANPREVQVSLRVYVVKATVYSEAAGLPLFGIFPDSTHYPPKLQRPPGLHILDEGCDRHFILCSRVVVRKSLKRS